jgi:hypothetical protein
VGRLIDALLRRATRSGFRRGMAGEHWAWFVIAGAAYLIQRARRPDDHSEQIDLQPGERYMVTLQPRGRRRKRKGASGEPVVGVGGSAATGTAEDVPEARPATG